MILARLLRCLVKRATKMLSFVRNLGNSQRVSDLVPGILLSTFSWKYDGILEGVSEQGFIEILVVLMNWWDWIYFKILVHTQRTCVLILRTRSLRCRITSMLCEVRRTALVDCWKLLHLLALALLFHVLCIHCLAKICYFWQLGLMCAVLIEVPQAVLIHQSRILLVNLAHPLRKQALSCQITTPSTPRTTSRNRPILCLYLYADWINLNAITECTLAWSCQIVMW